MRAMTAANAALCAFGPLSPDYHGQVGLTIASARKPHVRFFISATMWRPSEEEDAAQVEVLLGKLQSEEYSVYDPAENALRMWSDALKPVGQYRKVVEPLLYRRPNSRPEGTIAHDLQQRILTPVSFLVLKPEKEHFTTGREPNGKYRRRRKAAATREDGDDNGNKKKTDPENLPYPNVPNPGQPSPMDALFRKAFRWDGSVFGVDSRNCDTVMILKSYLNGIENFPHDDYFRVDVWIDMKCHLMEVIGEKNCLDGVHGNSPHYFTRRHIYRSASLPTYMNGAVQYIPLHRQKHVDNAGQFALTCKFEHRPNAANGNNADGNDNINKHRYVLSFCPMVVTSVVLLKVGPLNPQVDGALVRYASGAIHDGLLMISPGMHHYGCFRAHGLTIGTLVYEHFCRDGLENTVLETWDPTGRQPQVQPQGQPPQQAQAQAHAQAQAPAPPVPALGQAQIQQDDENWGEVMRIQGGGPTVDDLYRAEKWDDDEAPLMDEDRNEVKFVGVLIDIEMYRPLPTVKKEQGNNDQYVPCLVSSSAPSEPFESLVPAKESQPSQSVVNGPSPAPLPAPPVSIKSVVPTLTDHESRMQNKRELSEMRRQARASKRRALEVKRRSVINENMSELRKLLRKVSVDKHSVQLAQLAGMHGVLLHAQNELLRIDGSNKKLEVEADELRKELAQQKEMNSIREKQLPVQDPPAATGPPTAVSVASPPMSREEGERIATSAVHNLLFFYGENAASIRIRFEDFIQNVSCMAMMQCVSLGVHFSPEFWVQLTVQAYNSICAYNSIHAANANGSYVARSR